MKPAYKWSCRNCKRQFKVPVEKVVTFRNEQEDWDCETFNACPFCNSIYLCGIVIKDES